MLTYMGRGTSSPPEANSCSQRAHARSRRRSNPPSHVRPYSFVSVRPGARASAVECDCDDPEPGRLEACHAHALASAVPTLATRGPRTSFCAPTAPGTAGRASQPYERDTWRREPEIMMEAGSVTMAMAMARGRDARMLWMRSMINGRGMHRGLWHL